MSLVHHIQRMTQGLFPKRDRHFALEETLWVVPTWMPAQMVEGRWVSWFNVDCSQAGRNFAAPAAKAALAHRPHKTHCVHGHSLEDAYVDGQGYRFCRTCRLARSRVAHARKRAAAKALSNRPEAPATIQECIVRAEEDLRLAGCAQASAVSRASQDPRT